MKLMKLLAVLTILAGSISVTGFAQAPPCPSGTLANVLGTSCTIGNLTFNFQTNFTGFIETVGPSGFINIVNISPDAVGFIPIQTGNQAGFLVKTNFFDNGNGTGLSFTMHGVGFSYSPQVNGAFEILGETAKVMGNIGDLTPFSFDSITAFDGQCFTNGQCVGVQPRVAFDPQHGGLFDQPSVSATLAIPGVTGTGLPGQSFTTQINSFAIGGGEATLDSALYLLTVAPQTPLPSPAKLNYKNIDLPEEAFTSAIGINNSGDIGGTATDFLGGTHAYLRKADGNNLTLIDFPGATATFLSGINDRDDVVGLYVDIASVVHGFLWKDGSFSTIDFPNSMFNSADGINDPGVIAGFFQSPDFGVHGYRLKDGNFTIIDDPNAFPGSNGFPTFTEVFSINNRGQVVGLSTDLFGLSHSFLLSDGVFHRIDVPAAVEGTAANGLNELDQVVGQFTDVNLNTHGFLLTNNIFSTVDFPGATITAPSQINSSGFIVGTYADDVGNPHGFLAAPANTADSVAPSPSGQSANGPPKPNVPARSCVFGQLTPPNPRTGTVVCNPRN